VNSGTSADQSLATFSAGPCTGYTGNASVINGSQALTTTWTKYTFTGSVGSAAQEIGIAFGYTPTGTAGADDNIYITGIQLEKGTVATSFDWRPYGTELALCQRYFQLWNAGWTGVSGGTSYSISSQVSFGTQMRSSPTVTLTGFSAGTSRYVSSAWSTFGINANGFTPYVVAASAGGNDNWNAQGTAAAEL
jgi:hypothetical protein